MSNPADEFTTALYRRFKEWSKRGFSADDVTWCEVRAEVEKLLQATQGRKARKARPR